MRADCGREVDSVKLAPVDELCPHRTPAIYSMSGSFRLPRHNGGRVLVPETDYYEQGITGTEAAEEFGVDVSTICQWVRRGYLAPMGRDIRMGRSVPVYRRGEVATVERERRRNALHGRARGLARSA